MGVISVSFVRLFGLSDSSSCIRLNCKLVGQPFPKCQKPKNVQYAIKLSLVVDHTNKAQKHKFVATTMLHCPEPTKES